MKEPVEIESDDAVIKTLNFKPYRNMQQRRVVPFSPDDDEPQTMGIITPWGAELMANKGDMLISEMDKPDDVWPVAPDIFDETYIIVGPGYCVKRAVTLLVPMTDITNGDADQMVTVHTMEGTVTVRAGDFFLAKGVQEEIWPYPKEKVEKIMKPAE